MEPSEAKILADAICPALPPDSESSAPNDELRLRIRNWVAVLESGFQPERHRILKVPKRLLRRLAGGHASWKLEHLRKVSLDRLT
jgi:hypothetical protein